jgi:hypothetical protein
MEIIEVVRGLASGRRSTVAARLFVCLELEKIAACPG